MKKGFYTLLILCAAMIVASCNKTKSYTDMLKAQDKAFSRLIEDSGFVILDDWPKDSVFKPNEFVKIDNDYSQGVYLNIIDKGNNKRAEFGKTNIQTRFTARMFMEKAVIDTGTIDLLGPHSNGTHPVEFKYGQYDAGLYDYIYNMFIGPGLAAGLPYVGDSSYVKLIVPFEEMTDLGMQYGASFSSSGVPVYFSKVKYIFKK